VGDVVLEQVTDRAGGLGEQVSSSAWIASPSTTWYIDRKTAGQHPLTPARSFRDEDLTGVHSFRADDLAVFDAGGGERIDLQKR
jgi:hypothetical protein